MQKVIKKKDDQFKVFSKEEQELIIANLDFRNVIDRLIYVAFYTGLRLGEILALKWVRLITGTLHVREQYQRETVFHEDGSKSYIYVMKDMLKTPHSERDIPIPDKIIKFLNSLERISDLVFCNENGNPLERKRPDRRIKILCRQLGIDDSRTFHSVRHSYCTRLFEANVPIKTAQVLMGIQMSKSQ
ncbi:Tyrosine recombinase XerD [Fusobacterium necrophorum subsp. necrophorum]|nr:Tyrosine recombinase XerD [Fusobacterium necrophorum subsp. necrophorum]